MATAERPRTDLFGIVTFLLYVVVGGFLVFGFAWALRGAVDIQNESVCRALNPQSRTEVSGTVLGSDGQPVVGAKVSAVVDGEALTPVQTGPDGSFAVFPPAGANGLRVEPAGGEPFEAGVTTSAGETAQVQVSLEDGGGELEVIERGRLRAPTGELRDMQGNPVKLEDYRGKFVVLNFWATWCEPCITEWPQLHQLAERLAESEDVVVLAVSIDEKQADIEPFLARMGLSQTPVTVLWDPTQKMGEQLGTIKIPDTYFVNEQGEVSDAFVNIRKWGAPEGFHCVQGRAG